MTDIPFEKLLTALSKAVSYKFRADSVSSVLFSTLSTGAIYGSIVRYPGGGRKVVITSFEGISMQEALTKLTNSFLKEEPVTTPISELHELVKTRTL